MSSDSGKHRLRRRTCAFVGARLHNRSLLLAQPSRVPAVRIPELVVRDEKIGGHGLGCSCFESKFTDSVESNFFVRLQRRIRECMT